MDPHSMTPFFCLRSLPWAGGSFLHTSRRKKARYKTEQKCKTSFLYFQGKRALYVSSGNWQCHLNSEHAGNPGFGVKRPLNWPPKMNQPPNLRQFPDSFFWKNLWGIDIQVLPGFVLRYTTECSRWWLLWVLFVLSRIADGMASGRWSLILSVHKNFPCLRCRSSYPFLNNSR